MVIESEIKQEKIERRGGARLNGGRKKVFPDVPATRKQIVLPDEWWDSLKEMYPDSSFAMIIYRALSDHSNLEFD